MHYRLCAKLLELEVHLVQSFQVCVMQGALSFVSPAMAYINHRILLFLALLPSVLLGKIGVGFQMELGNPSGATSDPNGT